MLGGKLMSKPDTKAKEIIQEIWLSTAVTIKMFLTFVFIICSKPGFKNYIKHYGRLFPK
jgi:hypothetical protein